MSDLPRRARYRSRFILFDLIVPRIRSIVIVYTVRYNNRTTLLYSLCTFIVSEIFLLGTHSNALLCSAIIGLRAHYHIIIIVIIIT